jgi:hypothetical protein
VESQPTAVMLNFMSWSKGQRPDMPAFEEK